MEDARVGSAVIQSNKAIVDEAIGGLEENCDVRKFCFEIRDIAGVELVADIVGEYGDGHAGIHVLQQPQRFDIDVIVDDVDGVLGECVDADVRFVRHRRLTAEDEVLLPRFDGIEELLGQIGPAHGVVHLRHDARELAGMLVELGANLMNVLLHVRHLHGQAKLICLGDESAAVDDVVLHGLEGHDQCPALLYSEIAFQHSHEHIDALLCKCVRLIARTAPT